MDDAERCVTILDRLDQHAKGINVGKLVKGDVLLRHLAPYGISALFAARHLRLDAGGGEFFAQHIGEFQDAAERMFLQIFQPA